MRKTFMGVFVAMVAALSFSMAQAAQIDGLQTRSGPDLPLQSALHVYVNPGDTGDALIGGYYNARNALTFISLVNTSDTTGTVVKVRFREGKYSNEVLDFFVCLSAGDRWQAWVLGDDNPDNSAYLLRWDDDTPTAPAFPSSGIVPFIATGCVTEDMTKEGYFTIIGVSSWLDDPGPLTRAVDTDSKCREVVGQGNADDFCVDPPNTDDSCIDLIDVGNYLTATVQIYDLTTGPASYAYNTTALADFRANIVPNPGLGADDPPLLTNCQDGIDGLNYVLMKSSLVAFYDIEGLLGGHTDVVLTFPTKRQTLETIGAQNPFQGDQATATEIVPCDWTDMTHDPCEVIIVEQWDDEENLPGTTIGFSPSEPDERELCNEVNYIVVGESTSTPSLLDTDLKQFTIVQTGFDIGWINFVMTGTGRFISLPFDATSDMTSYGLPTIGYELGSFLEEYLTHMLPLRYKTTVQQTAAGG